VFCTVSSSCVRACGVGGEISLSKKKTTYHASAFSMTSVLTKASRHCCMSTLLLLVDGIGKDRYIKLLYVVDVYDDKRPSLAAQPMEAFGRDSPCGKSGTLADSGTVPGKSLRRDCCSACDRSSIPARSRFVGEASRAPLLELASPHTSAC
jgi:hypothetical protein